jgi:hypothetical protein
MRGLLTSSIQFVLAIYMFYSAYSIADTLDRKLIYYCALGIAFTIFCVGMGIESTMKDGEDRIANKLIEIWKEIRYELPNNYWKVK